MTDSDNAYPLRTARKHSTRTALVDAAAELFARKGVEDATLDEVAAHAGMHVQTLYRHFPSKAALAQAIELKYLERFRERIEDPARTEDTLTFWRDWVETAAREVTERDGGRGYRAAIQQRFAATAVPGNLLASWFEYEELLARSLARDLGVHPDKDPQPRLIACALWAGNVNAARRWVMSEKPGQTLSAACVAVVDGVVALLGGEALRKSKKTGSSRAAVNRRRR
ncbi:MAG TPA: TetR/AcrR family transcriptional regulator [Povalibacter sp.]|uniref:TetR/AcrR family transcriptional regulator n=1 Tax=Povalibacter sp. TaxID=1962978 RepID=UPI002BEB1924|nr:TetR/AcrR family transcriptional regulator [Povalibacter sp.]HMN43758.1 TetR/AcrR family transcriptional regulator [Povalibacter sp.]